jgi:hypothetical protein
LKAKPIAGAPTETRRQKDAVGLRYGDAQEPVAIEIRVRAVDARDGG